MPARAGTARRAIAVTAATAGTVRVGAATARAAVAAAGAEAAASAPSAPREADAAELHVALAGDEAAPPLVLLHGLGGTWRLWRRTIDGFARSFRVVAV